MLYCFCVCVCEFLIIFYIQVICKQRQFYFFLWGSDCVLGLTKTTPGLITFQAESQDSSLLCSQLVFITTNRYKAKSARGKAHNIKSGENQAQAFKGSLPSGVTKNVLKQFPQQQVVTHMKCCPSGTLQRLLAVGSGGQSHRHSITSRYQHFLAP